LTGIFFIDGFNVMRCGGSPFTLLNYTFIACISCYVTNKSPTEAYECIK